jgi:hypothetical protein
VPGLVVLAEYNLDLLHSLAEGLNSVRAFICQDGGLCLIYRVVYDMQHGRQIEILQRCHLWMGGAMVFQLGSGIVHQFDSDSIPPIVDTNLKG